MDNAIDLNDVNFDQEVKRATQPVLVDFFAPWCGPCKMQSPIVDKLSSEFSGKARIGKINIDENKVSAEEYSVSSIPSLLVFKDGKMVERLTGLHTQHQLSTVLNKYL